MEPRNLLLNSLDEVAEEARRLNRDGYTQLGEWNLSEICAHLSLVMRKSISGFRGTRPSWWARTFVQPALRRRVFNSRRLPFGIELPPSLRPDQTRYEGDAVYELSADLQRVRDHEGKFADHPMLGRLTPVQWRQFHVFHAAHHLAMLEPKER